VRARRPRRAVRARKRWWPRVTDGVSLASSSGPTAASCRWRRPGADLLHLAPPVFGRRGPRAAAPADRRVPDPLLPCPRARCRVPAVPTLSLRDPRASAPSCRRGPLPAAAARRPRRQNGDPDPDSDPAARGRRCRLPNPPGCRWRPSHRTHPRRSFPASWSGPPWASCPVFEPLRAAWRGTPCASLARGVKDFSAVPRVVPEPFPFSPGSPLGCTASCTVHPQETGGSVSTRRRGCAGRRAGRRGGPS